MNKVRQTAKDGASRIILVVVLGVHHILEGIWSAEHVQGVDNGLNEPRCIAGGNDRVA